MIERENFVQRWKEEFGCAHGDICWCDTVIKLGFLYDDLVESMGAQILSFAEDDKVEPGTVGDKNLPRFMSHRRGPT